MCLAERMNSIVVGNQVGHSSARNQVFRLAWKFRSSKWPSIWVMPLTCWAKRLETRRERNCVVVKLVVFSMWMLKSSTTRTLPDDKASGCRKSWNSEWKTLSLHSVDCDDGGRQKRGGRRSWSQAERRWSETCWHHLNAERVPIDKSHSTTSFFWPSQVNGPIANWA